ncbi:DUF3288 family protein [Anthocerotibacter panamensis]|uniref:DUF3288 family protein n=1 Tax=Anthocerotibacter panamensis TaxID=2857077 RepID=UPI001C4042A6|nr:DUF3288 family protein [Anthocerotibacter panamensis]
MSAIHPQHNRDLQTLQTLNANPPDDGALADLARLVIRYQDFKGAEDIHALIQQLLQGWGFTPETLFRQTREIHRDRPVFRGDSMRQEDWA